MKTNLEAGWVRLVFVSDQIPSELRRIIEYLNGQMNPTEVYGVEIKQYVGPKLRTLVPRLIGRTADAGRAKSAGGTAQGEAWTWDRFESVLRERGANESLVRARQILDWVEERGLGIWWGKGSLEGGFVPIYVAPDGARYSLMEVWTSGRIEVFFKWLATKGAFADEVTRRELRDRLNAIDGVSIPEVGTTRLPSIRYDTLPGERPIVAILEVFDWVIERIKGS